MLCDDAGALAQPAPFDKGIIRRWKEYEQFSRQLQGTMRQEYAYASSGKAVSETIKYRQNQECTLRLHSLGTDTEETINLTNARYSAELKRDIKDPDRVVIVECNVGPQGPLQSRGRMSLAERAFVETSPHYSYNMIKLSDLISSPEFSVRGSSKETRDGKELVRVVYTYDHEERGEKIHREGSLFLDPSQCWCIRELNETEITYRGGAKHRTMDWRISYETADHPSGFPLVSRYTKRFDGIYEANKKKSTGTITGTCEWDIGSAPNSEFTLSAFGLPEPGGTQQPIPWYLWAALLGIVCLAAAAVLRWRARRGSGHAEPLAQQG